MIRCDAYIGGDLYSWHYGRPYELNVDSSKITIFVCVPRAFTQVCSQEVRDINAIYSSLHDNNCDVYIVTADSSQSLELWLMSPEMTINGAINVPVLGIRPEMLDQSFESAILMPLVSSNAGFPDRVTVVIKDNTLQMVDKKPLEQHRNINNLVSTVEFLNGRLSV